MICDYMSGKGPEMIIITLGVNRQVYIEILDTFQVDNLS